MSERLSRRAFTTPQLVRSIYDRNAAGCCWHLVLDDGNAECFAFCAEEAAKAGHIDCILLSDFMISEAHTRAELEKLTAAGVL